MSAFEQNRLPRSVRCYRALLRVYPRAFREEFELLLCQAFGDLSQRAASGGGMRRIGFWLRTVVDLLSSAIDHRFGNSPVRSLRLRWVLACAMGIPLGAV